MVMFNRRNNTNIDVETNKRINKKYKKRYDEAIINHEYDIAKVDDLSSFNKSYITNNVTKYVDDKELILKYRTMAEFSDVSTRIRKIINACIVVNYEDPIMKLKFRTPNNISKSDQNKYIKSYTEFLSEMENLNEEVESMFRQWFIDGRLYIRKVRNDDNKVVSYDIINPFNISKEYDHDGGYKWKIYNVVNKKHNIVDKQDVIYVTSGEYDGYTPISFLHYSMKVAYELNMLKNSLMIHRIVRAPMRYAIYIDVGKMDGDTAFSLINRYKNEYNLERFFDEDGLVVNANRTLMSENFWFSRHDNKNTEMDTIGGDVNISDIEDVNMFIKDLDESMNMPSSRTDREDGGGNVYLNTNIEDLTQDERDFRKYVMKLRYRFSKINIEMFKTYLLDNGYDEDKLKKDAPFFVMEFSEDEHYERVLKYVKIKGMVELLDSIKDFMGRPDENNDERLPIFSVKYILTKVLGMTEDEIKQMREEIDEEYEEGYYWYREKDED